MDRWTSGYGEEEQFYNFDEVVGRDIERTEGPITMYKTSDNHYTVKVNYDDGTSKTYPGLSYEHALVKYSSLVDSWMKYRRRTGRIEINQDSFIKNLDYWQTVKGKPHAPVDPDTGVPLIVL